jgi:hypothetical protein
MLSALARYDLARLVRLTIVASTGIILLMLRI